LKGKEVNIVTYDPEKVTIAKMKKTLTSAGTYRGIHKGPGKDKSDP
jgi:hypothetical protein